MEKIKVELVDIFNMLEKKEKDEKNKQKYVLLKKIYQKINMNDKLVMKLNKELTENEGTYNKLTIFNKTNFENLFNEMTEEEKTEINDKLLNLKNITLKVIIGETEEQEHECGDDCEHNHIFDPNQLMNNKKMQKILNNKKLRYNLEQQLRKTTGMKNSSLEEILKENIPKEQRKMFDSILKNETVNKLTEKLMNEETLSKIKNLFLDIVEREEIKVELDKFKCIINEDNFIESITEIYDEFQKTGDLKDIERLVKENTKLQDVLKKLDAAFKNDTLNIDKIKGMLQNVLMDFSKGVQSLNIIDETDIKNIKNLGGQFNLLSGFFGETRTIEDEKTKKDKEKKRREKAKKDYRRKLRNELKKNNKNNKNKKNPRGGSV